MLPAPVRMRAKDDFRGAVRRGSRCGCTYLVLHLLVPAGVPQRDADLRESSSSPAIEGHPQRGVEAVDVTVRGRGAVSGPLVPRIGFVVSRQVGGSVVRNRVQRRLRHAAQDVAPELPPGALLVVRALPGSAQASYAALHDDLGRGVRRCLAAGRSSRAGHRAAASSPRGAGAT